MGADRGKHLVRGGRVVDPSQGIDAQLDLLLEDGVITRLEAGLADTVELSDCTLTKAEGLVVAPGFIDLRVHLREPGEEHKETIASGLRAAAAGGFTAVACLANTQPVNDQRAVTELILREAERHPYARVYPIGAVSKGLRGEELAEIGDLVGAGAVALSDGDVPVVNGGLLRRALEYAQHYGVPVFQHAEDPHLADEGVMHEGTWSTRLGLPGIPGLAEDAMVARDLLLAEDTGGRFHLAPLSTGRSLAMVRDAKRRGVQVTCEVTPHHLLLNDREVADSGFSTATKVRPPLRSAHDMERLREGLQDGTIDAIASDHAPHHPDAKEVQFSVAPPGIVGLETTVSLCLDRLVGQGVIDLSRLVELLSTGPARVLGLAGGSLAPGSPADITLLDLDREITVDPSRFHSLSRNTPFAGWRLRGAAVGTFLAGRPVRLP